VVVPVPESTTPHNGQVPSVRLNLETRQRQCFLKALRFEELATPACDCTGRRKTWGVRDVSGAVTSEGLYSVLSLEVGLPSVLGVHRRQRWQGSFVKQRQKYPFES